MADLTNQYNTPLPPDMEAQFQKLYPNPQDWKDYDLRGAWISGATMEKNGHLPDTWKKPNHPTFSVDSKYNNPERPAGSWLNLGHGRWKFHASPYNFMYQTPEQLQQYFKEKEPNSQLVLPEVAQPGFAFKGTFP